MNFIQRLKAFFSYKESDTRDLAQENPIGFVEEEAKIIAKEGKRKGLFRAGIFGGLVDEQQEYFTDIFAQGYVDGFYRATHAIADDMIKNDYSSDEICKITKLSKQFVTATSKKGIMTLEKNERKRQRYSI